ncbi:hypothetical protein T12_1322 [Trichinella patagoniensis]|uniref:Uncharacterized protein n=1 Tax=Trichinella patagoniensis TaxID=990121 RepID=A0A0V0ZFC0_9BILA|nr:hypothetical protein T12_1322 [Trichinella patagoniensis]
MTNSRMIRKDVVMFIYDEPVEEEMLEEVKFRNNACRLAWARSGDITAERNPAARCHIVQASARAAASSRRSQLLPRANQIDRPVVIKWALG